MSKTLPPLPALPPAEVQEWSESWITLRGEGWTRETVEKYASDYALAAIEAQGVPDLIAGALYDFLGRLTSMEKPIAFGATEWATPTIDALVSFAEKRRLTLNNPAIENWTAACAERDARIAELERQLAEARAQVAEECAKVCETVGNHNITAACAGAIRARTPA